MKKVHSLRDIKRGTITSSLDSNRLEGERLILSEEIS